MSMSCPIWCYYAESNRRAHGRRVDDRPRHRRREVALGEIARLLEWTAAPHGKRVLESLRTQYPPAS